MEIASDAGRLADCKHQFDVDELDFFRTVVDAGDVAELVADVFLHFLVFLVIVHSDGFPVFEEFRAGNKVSFQFEFFFNGAVLDAFIFLQFFFAEFFFR